MNTTFDVDLEMGHVSGKSLEGAMIDVYDFDDDYYGGPRAGTSTHGEGVPVDHSYGGCTKSEKFDDAIFKSWKGRIESILLFIGLFSITVTLFIVECYKKLSPDPGEQAAALLNQASLHLMGISRGTPLDLPPSPGPISFGPSPLAIRACILWFMSLGLNVTCAIWAIYQWRRYSNLLGQKSEPHSKHARIRTYLSSGIGDLEIESTVEAIWVLLHASVFLSFIGLIDFLFLINKTVACIVLGYIAPLVLAYIATTLLLFFFPNSQYFTLSSGSWKVSQLDNQRSKGQSSFRRPPPGHTGENSLQDHHEHRVAVAH
ncbi:hypothetical protein EI94DRAFT_950474 [Lactarius quietus]|nr:hypothetical protein EI94DRAFT_950474 [Lactarius quietus]